jgi:hypothetical protein
MGFISGKLFKMKFAAVLAATISLALLTSCGSSGGSSVTPVQAATGYSNASVSGTYAFVNSAKFMIGTITANGNGNITSGTVNVLTSSAPTVTPSCTISVTGTYTVQSSGAGTATLIVTAGQSNPCSGGYLSQAQEFVAAPYLMEVAQQGSSLYLLNGSTEITATKQ